MSYPTTSPTFPLNGNPAVNPTFPYTPELGAKLSANAPLAPGDGPRLLNELLGNGDQPFVQPSTASAETALQQFQTAWTQMPTTAPWAPAPLPGEIPTPDAQWTSFLNQGQSMASTAGSSLSQLNAHNAQSVADLPDRLAIGQSNMDMSKTLGQSITDACQYVNDTVGLLLNKGKQLLNAITGAIMDAIGAVTDFISNAISAVMEKVQQAIAKVMEIANNIVNAIAEEISKIAKMIGDALGLSYPFKLDSLLNNPCFKLLVGAGTVGVGVLAVLNRKKLGF
jgi:hypothetical protein